jgi:hypothetical protein
MTPDAAFSETDFHEEKEARKILHRQHIHNDIEICTAYDNMHSEHFIFVCFFSLKRGIFGE